MEGLYRIDPLVLVGIPTLLKTRPLSWEWADSFAALGFPLGASCTKQRIYGEYVADARNALVKIMLQCNADYLMFIGDDVIVPPNLFSLLWRHRQHIVTGMYWTKQYPTEPYIWKDLLKGPYMDWKVGEFFELTWAGCDALLVHKDVFKAIEPPWFSHDWVWDYDRPQIPLATEDLYFFTKAHEKGFKIWCESAAQCGHQDRQTGVVYGLLSDMPQVNAEVKTDPKVKLIADLGSGMSSPHFSKYPKAKIVRFDINPELNPDVRCDVRAIPEPDEKYDIVHASHVLEHIPFWETKQVVGEWIRILKVGGELQIKVPNMEWAAEEIIKSAKDINHDATFAFGAVFGTRPDVQAGSESDPQFHRCGYTKTGLHRLAKLFPYMKNIQIMETMSRTELTLKAIKAKSSKPKAILPSWQEKKMR